MAPSRQPRCPDVVRLSPLLQASACNGINYDDLYWSSPEVHMAMAKADVLGLTMVLINITSVLATPLFKRPAFARFNYPIFVLFLLLAALQLSLLQKNWPFYCKYRHHFAVGNRLLRMAAAVLPAVVRRGDVMARWLAMTTQRSPLMALMAYACFPSVMMLQISLMFSLPTAIAVLVQPLCGAVALAWVWASPPSIHNIPGLQEVATAWCRPLHGTFQLVLYIVVELAAPAAG